MSDPIKPEDSAATDEKPDPVRAPALGTTDTVLSVPSKETGRRSPKAVSRTDFAGRLAGQMELLDEVLDMAEMIPEDHTKCSHAMLNDLLHVMDDHYGRFQDRHYFFVRECASHLIDHEYLDGKVGRQASRAHAKFRQRIFELKDKLAPEPVPVMAAPMTPVDRPERSKLPELKLPEFNGTYKEWPDFAKVFRSILNKEVKLSGLERFHYLRISVKGEAADLVAGLPMEDESFAIGWNILKDRYDNKRVHVQAHLSTIFALTPLTSKSAAGLLKIHATIIKAQQGLRALGVGPQLWEYVLVYHITHLLDRSTKEVWENTISTAMEYPSYDRMMAFLLGCARAQDEMEADAAKNKGASKKTAHQASAQQKGVHGKSGDPNAYPCDLCKGKHFIVACPKFRELSARDRRQAVVDKRLCFNCFGRHNANMCRSKATCKECSSKHHTMLHGASTRAAPATSVDAVATQQTSSTNTH